MYTKLPLEVFMNKLFLTGRPRCGKTTLLRTQVQGFESLGGFAVQRLIKRGQTWAFRMLDLAEEPYVPQLESNKAFADIVIYMKSQDKWQGDRSVFDEKGSRALEKCLVTQPLVIMDELGIFEREALAFQASVRNVLDSPLPVLGVIKDKTNPFLDQVRQLPQVQIERYPGDGVEAKVKNYLRRVRR